MPSFDYICQVHDGYFEMYFFAAENSIGLEANGGS
jgi:hypothetical protein